MQLVDDHERRDMVERERGRRRGEVLGMVGLLGEVATEEDVHRRDPAHRLLVGDGAQASPLERMLEARAWNAVEIEVEHQEPVRAYELLNHPEMRSRIFQAAVEIGFDLHTEDAPGQELLGAAQHVLLEALDVDLDEVGGRDHALLEQGVELSDGNAPDSPWLAAIDAVTIHTRLIERAGAR